MRPSSSATKCVNSSSPYSVACDVAPDVRAARLLLSLSEQVADDLAALDRDGAGRVLPLALDLRHEVRDVRQRRLERAMPRVTLRQQRGRALHVLVAEV